MAHVANEASRPGCARRARQAVAAVAFVAGSLTIGATQVGAGIGASAAPAFPAVITVGQTGIPAIVQISNGDTAGDSAAANRVCNFGDPFPCPVGEQGITLTPSCGGIGPGVSCAAPDAGVFTLAPVATGVVGTSCSGMPFDVTLIDSTVGTWRLTPQGGAAVQLVGNGADCKITVLLDVLAMPTVDQNPISAGVQTVQIVGNTQTSGLLVALARGSSNGTTILKASPAITTVASTANIGQPITDTAHVTGRVSPIDGATVTFNLYGAADTTCSAAPIFTSTVPLLADGTATSAGYTPPGPGTYRWIASYSGDANNNPVSGVCGEAGENGIVNRWTPTIATQASSAITRGNSVFDTATVSGRVNPQPGATVTFRLYGPVDLACLETPMFVSTVALAANGTAVSGTYTPPVAGTYRWIATYNGDANNSPVSGVCSDVRESVVVRLPPDSSPPIPPTL